MAYFQAFGAVAGAFSGLVAFGIQNVHASIRKNLPLEYAGFVWNYIELYVIPRKSSIFQINPYSKGPPL